MTRRSRIAGFGSAALLVVAGAVGVAVLPGIGSDLALGVMGVGVVVAVSLVFLEVGLSEDRELAREEAARRRDEERRAREEAARKRDEERRAREERGLREWRPLGRMRGRPRRLR